MENREMALTRFVKSSNTGDKYPTGNHLNKPVYVQPLEKFTGLKTDHDPEGENVVLRANLYDLTDKQAYGRIVLFNGALVDGLGQFLGEEVVVRFVDQKSKDGKRTYRAVQDGSDADYALAEGMIDEIRAAIEARLEELDSEAGSDDTAEETAPAGRSAFKR
jgi:hypothetical protein